MDTSLKIRQYILCLGFLCTIAILVQQELLQNVHRVSREESLIISDIDRGYAGKWTVRFRGEINAYQKQIIAIVITSDMIMISITSD